MARKGMAWKGSNFKKRNGIRKARHVMEWQGKERQMEGNGKESEGKSRNGMAKKGNGKACNGKARKGKAMKDKAR
jgi:hypothetical protein